MKQHLRWVWGLTCILAIFALISGARGPVYAQSPQGEETPASTGWRAGRVLVKYKPQLASSAEVFANLAQYNALRVDRIDSLGIDILQVPEGQELAVAAALNADPAVLFAEPDYEIHAFVTPNDTYYGNQWAHSKINSPAAWDITTGSASITIAIVDSGVDRNHPDLQTKLVTGKNYVDDDGDGTVIATDTWDLNGHGTHVSGIAAAMTNNSNGVAGMSWGAKIMPMRVLNNRGSGYMSDATSAIMDAIAMGADIINMSLGGDENSASMQYACDQAYNANVFVVAAAGNNNTAIPFYPAANNHVIAVSATGPFDEKAAYSNYGTHIDVAAPGGNMRWLGDSQGIYSTLPTYTVYLNTVVGYLEDYDYLHGTSQASPYVAGLAALLWSVDPTLTVDEIESILETTAVDLGTTGFDVYFGNGRIDAAAALQALQVAPDAPVLQAIVNPDQDANYSVEWNNVAHATSYVLQESSWSDFRTLRNTYTTTAISKVISLIPPDVWYYRVKAVNDTGESVWSETRSVGVVPPAPVIHAISSTGYPDAYVISWNGVTGADGYELLEGEDVTYITSTTRYMGASLAYTVTGQSGGDWYYKVRAYNEAGNGQYSGTVTTTIPNALLATPTLQAILNPNHAEDYDVKWTKVTGATLYVLEESATPYFDAPVVVYSGTQSTYPAANQLVGTWYYRVRAYDAINYSSWSGTQSTMVSGYTYLPIVVKDSIPSGVTAANQPY